MHVSSRRLVYDTHFIHIAQAEENLSGLFLGVKFPHFGAIAAALHVTPAAMVVLAGVEEKPFAIFGGAGADKRDLIGGKKVGGGTGDLPEETIEVVQVVEAPFEASVDRDETQVFGGDASVVVECGESFSRHGAMVDERPKDIMDGFTKFPGPAQGFFRAIRIFRAAGNELIDAAGSEQAGIFTEAGEIVVVLE